MKYRFIFFISIFFIISTPAYAWKISAGTVTMNDPVATPGYQTVSFTGAFFDVAPVVFVLAKDNPNTEPRALRIQNVTTAGFEIIQVRPTVCGGCSDTAGFNVHDVNWIAIEPGRHLLPGGQPIEVGSTSTTTVQKKFAGAEGWDTIAFSSAFSTASIAMVGQVQTSNNVGVSLNGGQTNPFITTAIRNANASNFQTALELNEVVTPLPLVSAETIGWLAAPSGLSDTLIDTGSGSVLIEAILSADNITHICSIDNNFSNSYASNPLVVASKNRLDGGDGGWMRECQITTSAVRLRVQEDEGTDNDVFHTTESAGLFVVEKAFDAEVIEATADWYLDGPSWTGAINEVVDSSGNNNHGTSFGGISPVTGKVCNAADLSANSITDYLSMNSNALDGLTNLTLSFWVNTSNTSNQAAVSAANAGSNNEFLAWFPNNTTFRPFVKNVGLASITIPDIADSNWHHIAWTRSGATNCVSVDGVLSGCVGGGSLAALNISAGGLIIGQEQDSVGGNFDVNQDWEGEIDEVIVFSDVFTPAEITTLYNNQNAGNNWDGSTRTCPGGTPTMEVVQVSLNDTSITPSFTSVTFKQTYTTSPLVFVLPSNEGPDPASIRIRNVTTTGFEISQLEPDNLDGPHPGMTVHYMAIEPGMGAAPWLFTLPDGRTLEVGTHATQSVQHGNGVAGATAWDTVNFTSTFIAPAVLAGIQGMANESANPPVTTSVPWLTVAMRNVGASSVQFALERAEVATGSISSNETIAYAVIEGDIQGNFASGSANILYESITSADNITGWTNNNCAGNVGTAVGFVNAYAIPPLVIANQSRRDGGDGGWLRRCSLTAAQIGLSIDEDQFANAERSHTTEAANLLVFSEAFCLPTACPGLTVDHYAINFPNGLTSLTCEPANVVITAHDFSDSAIVVPTGVILSLSTSTGTGIWQPALIAGSGTWTPSGVNDGNASYTWPAGESSFEVSLLQGAVGALSVNLLDNLGKTESVSVASEDPTITFNNFGFRITDAAGVSAVSVGTQISGKDSNVGFGAQTLFLQALGNFGGGCNNFGGPFNNINVQMALECSDPSVCEVVNGGPGTPATVQDDSATPVVIGINDSGLPNNNFLPVQLDFDAQTKAPLIINYPDAGEITLHFALGAFFTGSSNLFVERPFGFDVQITGNPGATGPGGAAFTSAGSPFTVTTSAVPWQQVDDGDNDGVPDGHESGDTDPGNNVDLSDNGVTPNYGQESIATEADVTLSGLLDQPGGGIDPGLSGGTSISVFASGSGSTATAQYDEVGIIEARAGVADSDYLGVGQIRGVSGHVGRFTPFDFNVGLNTAGFGAACGAFSYIGQSFVYTTNPVMTVTARNAATSITQNYTGTFFKLTDAKLLLSGNKTYAAAVGSLDLTLIPSPDPVIADTGSGTATLTFNDGGGIAFNRSAPLDPFDADIGLSLDVIDEDNIVFAGNPVNFGDASAGNGISFAGNKEQRWGRLVLDNAFGSELLPLEIPVRAEYQNSGDFITNTDDNCTDYTSANISFSNHSGITAGANLTASGAGTLINGVDDDANPLIISNTLLETGFVDVTHTIDFWLQYDWDNDTNHDNDPTSRATWGVFSGPDEFIYIREPW